MTASETRLELLKLVHTHGLEPSEVLARAAAYESYLNVGIEKPAALKKGGGGSAKSG